MSNQYNAPGQSSNGRHNGTYQPKDNTGTLFSNDQRGNQNAPIKTGRCVVNGEEYYMSVWENTSNNGNVYEKISFESVAAVEARKAQRQAYQPHSGYQQQPPQSQQQPPQQPRPTQQPAAPQQPAPAPQPMPTPPPAPSYHSQPPAPPPARSPGQVQQNPFEGVDPSELDEPPF